jgi:hypothetical protein
MDIIETIEYKGYNILTYQDENAESPRDWDNLGTMACFHRSYDLGDKTDLSTENFSGWSELEDYLRKELDAKIVLPLRLYDHSGITMYVGDTRDRIENPRYMQHEAWDSGQVGFIYATAKDIRESLLVKNITTKILEKAEETLRSEVQTYDLYLRGEVYYFAVEDSDGDDLDSCGGIYGYDETVDMAKESIDYEVNKPLSKQIKKVAPFANALHSKGGSR